MLNNAPRTISRLLLITALGVSITLLAACDVAVDPKDQASANLALSEDGGYEQFLAKQIGRASCRERVYCEV